MKNYLLALLSVFCLQALSAQEPVNFHNIADLIPTQLHPASAVARGASDLQLDSVWESGFFFLPTDSIVYRKEYYTYSDTQEVVNSFDLSQGNGFELLDRTTTQVKSDDDVTSYSFVEGFVNGIFDTTDLTLYYFNPLITSQTDSTKIYAKPVNSSDLKLSRALQFGYDDNQDDVEVVTNVYNTATSELFYSYRTEIIYQAPTILDKVFYYSKAAASNTWELTGKAEYLYDGTLLDSVAYFDNTPTGFELVQWTNDDYNPSGYRTKFEIFYLQAGVFQLSYRNEITRDDQNRPIQWKNTSFTNGVPTGGDLMTSTYVADYFPDLEKFFVLNVSSGQYDFSKAREYFYSGSVGTQARPVAEQLVVAPNPVMQALRVTAPAGAWVEIIASDGGVSMRRQLDQEGENTLNVSGLPAGVYFISATTPLERRVGVFVKL